MPNAKRLSALAMLTLLLFPGSAETAHAQCSVAYTFTGEGANDQFGGSVSGAGDVDGDGYADLIVGARENLIGGIRAGRAYVHSGVNGSLIHTFTGNDMDLFGTSVSGAGDVNNDGFDDLIVGAPGTAPPGWPPQQPPGLVRVYSGQTGTLLYTLSGEADGDYFGSAVSGAGDVNNDGYADVIVGAPLNDAGGTDAGRAHVYSGQTGTLLYTLTGEASGNRFGTSVSGAGDVNIDGFDDVIIGARGGNPGGQFAGRAYVYSGQTATLMYTFIGEVADDQFGVSVSTAGDVNSDGYADLVVGASGNDAGGVSAGRAYVYSGQTGTLLYTFTGEEVDFLGESVSSIGDIDNDGYADLVVGAPQRAYPPRAGRVHVYSGQTGILLYTFTGEAAEDHFGLSVSGAGDTNGDGIPDLIVGAYRNNAGGTEAGRAYLFTCIPPAIPTLTEWGMIALALLLLGGLGWYARRLRAAVTTVT